MYRIGKYKLDDGQWQDSEEFLRIDDKCRKILGFPLADGRAEQPWVIKDDVPENYVTLLFDLESEFETKNVYIAAEEVEYIKINGREIDLTPKGWYTDKSIIKYDAGKFLKGVNTIEAKVPISKRISLENIFVLGDFDVKLNGCKQTIIPRSDTIGFSDITSQGMPFYGGNVIYKTEIDVPESTLKIRVNRYRGALIKVFIDGKDVGNIVYPPYILKTNVDAGKHIVEFKLFGNRVNTFGPLHESSKNICVGPERWYSTDYEWAYEYEPKPTGILASPLIDVIKSTYKGDNYDG